MNEEELLRNFLCGKVNVGNVNASDHLHTLSMLLFERVASNQSAQNKSSSSQERPFAANIAADAPAAQSMKAPTPEGAQYSENNANSYALKCRPCQSLNLQSDGDVWSGTIYLRGEKFPATWCRKTGQLLTAKKSANDDINQAFEMRQALHGFNLIDCVQKKAKPIDKEVLTTNYRRENLALKAELENIRQVLKMCQNNIRAAREEAYEARTSVAAWRDKYNKAEFMLNRKSADLIEAARQKTELLNKISQLEETVRESEKDRAVLAQKIAELPKGGRSFWIK